MKKPTAARWAFPRDKKKRDRKEKNIFAKKLEASYAQSIPQTEIGLFTEMQIKRNKIVNRRGFFSILLIKPGKMV